jgi:bifunctional DNase/RNase
MIEVILRAVRVDMGSSTPVLLLEEVHGSRVLPIFIGAPEAAAIAYALQGIDAPRPMTHDLLGSVITSLGAKVLAIEISDLVESTYHATLRLVQNGRDLSISSRPSDAVALALRVGAPMLVNDELMRLHGQHIEGDIDDEDDEDNEDPDSILDEFRAFLDDVRPEEFG